MTQQDQLEMLTREVWRLNLAIGFQKRIGYDLDGKAVGRLAKASGATPGQVAQWLAGGDPPATGQALALLSALPLPAAGASS